MAMVPVLEPLPFPPAWRAFTRREAITRGISDARLLRSDVVRLGQGLHRRTGTTLREVDLVAAVCRTYDDATAIGFTAARLHGMPLPSRRQTWRPSMPVEMSRGNGHPRSGPRIRWSRLRLDDRDRLRAPAIMLPTPLHVLASGSGSGSGTDGGERALVVDAAHARAMIPPDAAEAALRITLATRSRTWRDLAPILTEQQLVIIADHLLRRPRPQFEDERADPYCTREELAAQCTGRHAATLRAALDRARIGSDSPKETQLRLAFVAAGLPEPLLNRHLIGSDGRRLHQPDFQWPEQRLCAEYDGRTHSTPHQVQRDIERERRVEKAGFHQLRLSADDTRNGCRTAIVLVRRALLARGWKPVPTA